MAITIGSSRADAAGLPGTTGYLGDAQPFSVLAGSTVTNAPTFTGAPTHVWGDVGVAPGTAITGLQSNQVGGTLHSGDAAAGDAQTSLTSAYVQAAGLGPSSTVQYPELGGLTLDPGVYNATSGMALTGKVTLDGHGNPDAYWVFQAGSTLVTGSNSEVSVVNGNPCNVYWQVGSSATLGTGTAFIGTVMADQSIAATTGATIEGRLLARSAAVTLDSNQITAPICALTDATGATIPASTPSPTASPSATSSPNPTATPSPTASSTPVATPRPEASSGPTATPSPTSSSSPSGSGGAGGTSNDTLATTGSDFTPQLSIAIVLLALGSLLVAIPAIRGSRLRRRAATATRR
jgi:hypothetical protein